MVEGKYITKKYLDETLDKRFLQFEDRLNKSLDKKLDEKLDKKLDEKLDKKLDEKFKLWDIQIRQYMKDLTSGFNDKIKGMGDYVVSVEERVSRLEDKIK